MNAQKYKQILQENVMSSVESLQLPSDYIFLRDNDPKHTAKSTKKWYYLPTPPLGQDITQGQFLSGV